MAELQGRSAPRGGAPWWLWTIVVLILLGGGALVFSMGRGAGAALEGEGESTSEPWADVEPDAVDQGGGAAGEMDRPVLGDSTGGR